MLIKELIEAEIAEDRMRGEPSQKHVDPETGIRPVADWGAACARGFVSDARFGPGQTVIKRTSQAVRKKNWRKEPTNEA